MTYAIDKSDSVTAMVATGVSSIRDLGVVALFLNSKGGEYTAVSNEWSEQLQWAVASLAVSVRTHSGRWVELSLDPTGRGALPGERAIAV